MRCRYCGADQLTTVTRKDGYSFKKGITGTAILGPVGAVAGIDGKEKKYFHCPICGEDMSAPMSTDVSMDILTAIRKKDIYKLRQYKQKFRNIEWNDDNTENALVDSVAQNPIQQEEEKTRKKSNPFDDIKNYLREMDTPVEYNEILNAVVSPSCEKEVAKATILSLIEQGLIKYRSGFFALVKDIDEMVELKGKGTENKAFVESELNQREKEEEIIRVEQEKEELGQFAKKYISKVEGEKADITNLLRPIEDNLRQCQIEQEKLIKNREVYYTQTKQNLENERIAHEEWGQKLVDKIDVLTNKIRDKEKELAGLSFLQGKKKKIIQTEIDSLAGQIKTANEELTNIEKSIELNNRQLISVERDYENKIDNLTQNINEVQQAVDSYKERIKKREIEIDMLENSDYTSERFKAFVEASKENEASKASGDDKFKKKVEKQLIDQLSKYPCAVTKKQLWEDIHRLENESMHLQILSDQRLSAVLIRLRNEGIVKQTKRGDVFFFEII